MIALKIKEFRKIGKNTPENQAISHIKTKTGQPQLPVIYSLLLQQDISIKKPVSWETGSE
ncbi:hypothetical protein IW15_12800 [Chryseobacterium soli]|uniref:Uncharacterized protein n=1 Tax=Chryseobacterium soli TaxID=445961 RepID=A0A086A6W0_9FLAO|nr:hypothetical protein IW15_12800 [Chryseobacterium soli]